METLAPLAHGFAVAITPYNLLWSALGVTVGTAIGVLPGIGPALTVALLLPVTYGLEPTSAFIMFAGIYYGAMYGGSTTAILLNTPGESGSIVTAIDGHEMARQGRGAQALATAAIGSFVAGTIATVALTFVAPLMVKMALLFGPAEYFALMVLALTTVTAVLGASLSRGLASLFFGLALGLVGIDLQTGQARLTFGIPELLDGIDTVVVAVGLFAIGETLYNAARYRFEKEEIYALKGSKWMSREDWKRSWKPWLRGTVLGFPIGALPAGGSEIPTFLSYLDRKAPDQASGGVRPWRDRGRRRPGSRQQRVRRRHAGSAALAGPADFGDRRDHAGRVPAIRPAARSAAVRQQPGTGLGHDRQPLYRQCPAAAAQPAAGRSLGEAAGHPAGPGSMRGILVFATLGAYTLNNNVVDLVILWIIGLLGFGMRVLDVPVAPCVVGLILGPLAEQQFRRALAISQGDPTVFFTHPLSLGLLVTAAAARAGAGGAQGPAQSSAARRARTDLNTDINRRRCIIVGAPPSRIKG